MQKYIKHKERYETDQQTIKYFDKLYSKSLQDNVIDRNEDESLCNIFARYVVETRNSFF